MPTARAPRGAHQDQGTSLTDRVTAAQMSTHTHTDANARPGAQWKVRAAPPCPGGAFATSADRLCW